MTIHLAVSVRKINLRTLGLHHPAEANESLLVMSKVLGYKIDALERMTAQFSQGVMGRICFSAIFNGKSSLLVVDNHRR